MARMELTLANLSEFYNGLVSVAWQQALGVLVADLRNRKGDKRARELILSASLKPIVESDGDLIDAEVIFSIKTKLPPRLVNPKPLGVNVNNQLFFNNMAPDNPHQMTIDEAGD